MNVTCHDVLIHIPLVSGNAPEWKRVCPFCGAADTIHEVEGFYVCHECLANWLERDTPTERQIQVLNLNDGTMPVPGEGEMPIVFREMERCFIALEVDLKNETVTFRNRDGGIYAVRSLWEWAANLFVEGGNHHAGYVCA